METYRTNPQYVVNITNPDGTLIGRVILTGQDLRNADKSPASLGRLVLAELPAEIAFDA